MNTYIVTVNGISYTVEVKERRGTSLTFVIDQEVYTVEVESQPHRAPGAATVSPVSKQPSIRSSTGTSAALSILEVRAPLPGIISDIKVAPGDTVQTGTVLLVIEAMKMENPIKSPRDAKIKAIHVSKGQEVGHNALILSFD